MALHVAQRLHAEAAHPDLVFLSGGTDGQDGPTDATGAVVDRRTVASAEVAQLAQRALARCDAYNFFLQSCPASLLRPGLTGTNVMDLQVVLLPASGAQ